MFSNLGLTKPVIQAPMAGISTPRLTAAVAEADALGFVALGTSTAQGAAQTIAETRALTALPFGVNLFCHSSATRDPATEAEWLQSLRPDFARFGTRPPTALREIYPSFRAADDMLALLVHEAPPVISFHFGLPRQDQLRALRETGAMLIATATSLTEGQQIAKAGLDAIVVQGWQAGGHRGRFDPDAVDQPPDERLETLSLLRRLGGLGLPLIAAGGIMSAADRRAAMDAGASAVQCGTAFLLAPEAATTAPHRQRLKQAETAMMRAISGRAARGLINRFARMDQAAAPAYPVAYDAAKALHAAASAQGDYSFAAYWAGTGAAQAAARPAAQTIAEISG